MHRRDIGDVPGGADGCMKKKNAECMTAEAYEGDVVYEDWC